MLRTLRRKDDVEAELSEGYKKSRVYILRYIALYPNVNSKWYYLNGIWASLVISQFIYHMVAYVIALRYAILWKDLDLIAETMEYLCVITYYFYAALNTLTRRPLLDDLLRTLGRCFYTYSTRLSPRELEIISNYKTRERLVARAYMTFFFLSNLYFLIILRWTMVAQRGVFTSIVEGETVPINKLAPIRAWMPYDSTNFLTYMILCINQIIPSVILGIVIVGTDLTYVSFMSELTCQFDLLNESLRQLSRRALEKRVEDKANFNSLQTFEECLKENIAHHKVLLEFSKKLQSFYGLWLLILFTGSALVICGSGVIMSNTTEILSTLNNFMGFLLSLATVLLYCWYSEDLTRASEEFQEALYNTPWYLCSVKFRRILHISLIQSQRPVRLSAAGFIDASVATYSEILKKAYSYFNLMRASGARTR